MDDYLTSQGICHLKFHFHCIFDNVHLLIVDIHFQDKPAWRSCWTFWFVCRQLCFNKIQKLKSSKRARVLRRTGEVGHCCCGSPVGVAGDFAPAILSIIFKFTRQISMLCACVSLNDYHCSCKAVTNNFPKLKDGSYEWSFIAHWSSNKLCVCAACLDIVSVTC